MKRCSSDTATSAPSTSCSACSARERGSPPRCLQKLGADLNHVRQAVIQQLFEPAGIPEAILATLPPEFRRHKPKSPFTEREWIVLSLLIEEGMTTREIGELLDVSEEKVGEIIQAVAEKLKGI